MHEAGNAVESRNRSCPRCAAPTVVLPWFTSRRRHAVTCTNCGARLQRVLPGVPYYTLALVTGLLSEAAILPMLIFILLGKWGWIAATVIGLMVINLGASAFLNARTRVEFEDPADARKDKPGRWYPQ
jgi:hypothetical protein